MHPPPRLAAAALCAALAVSCGGTSPDRTALLVVVDVDPAARSRCLVVTAGGDASAPIALAGKSQVKVGVARAATSPGTVRVQAIGHQDDGCTTLTSPAERSAAVDATFKSGEVVTVSLALAAPRVDADQDGYGPPADCNDNNFAVNPGVPEDCTNKIDDDCNGFDDCKDSACAGQFCGTRALCNLGECHESDCADLLDNDGDGATDCADQDCDGRPCPNGGTCANLLCGNVSTEANLCADDFDNDGDGLKDCADVVDCPSGSACTDKNLCTQSEACGAGPACAGGQPVTCGAPPSACFGAGTCTDPDAGCTWAPTPDAGCDDGDACTVQDRCAVDGGCAGAPRTCNAPGVCRVGPGTCVPGDGGCEYPPADAGVPCNDGNNCSYNDACNGSGTCTGTLRTCTPAPCFDFSGTCFGDGGCNFVPLVDVACDGGRCNPQSTCVPTATWPYAPSNFDPAQLPAPTNAITLSGCNAVIRTQTFNAPVVETWCAGAVTPRFTQQGTGQPWILNATGFTVASSATLRVYGTTPLILAIEGNVSLLGDVEVGARMEVPGAGGNDLTCANQSANGTRPADNSNAAGGGGGAGYTWRGADGGAGEGSGNGVGGLGGAALTLPSASFLQGGCWGGRGGGGSVGAPGGGGGGAFQVSATGTVTVNSAVSAAGGGGRGAGGQNNGGGAGGSGGMILLEALSVDLQSGAALTANGGSGGEGSDDDDNGNDGSNGSPDTNGAASGGTGGSNGGAGGVGGAGTSGPGAGIQGTNSGDPGGGGGGGGSVGRVRLNVVSGCSINGGAVRSPPATSNKNGSNGCP